MKKLRKWGAAFLLIAVLLASLPGMAEGDLEGIGIILDQEETGNADSFVHVPVLTYDRDDHPLKAQIDQINQRIQDQAQIPAYLQLLSGIAEGSTGLQVDYDYAFPQWIPEAHYLSLLISARGKMLSGRPSQVYYPMTFDLLTGEEVPFERLFTDPDGAKAWIEAHVADEIAPTLSTYLENSDLLPVPFDRYFLDGQGNLILLYENSQLSFLSGDSGAVAFRYSELWDFLDTSEDGVPMQVMWHPDKYALNNIAEMNSETIYNDALYGLGVDLYLGDPLESVLAAFRATTDSGYYPGGAYYEVEYPTLRGTLVLTDEKEETVTGLLSARVDQFGVYTGKTTLADAIALMEEEPLAQLPISEAAADMYRVCPGTAAVYHYTDMEERDVSFTLYADREGVVQYIKLALE